MWCLKNITAASFQKQKSKQPFEQFSLKNYLYTGDRYDVTAYRASH